MNALRATYIVCDLIFSLALLALAVFSPVWITPGQYWWTALSIFFLLGQANSFTKRLNSWDGMGEV